MGELRGSRREGLCGPNMGPGVSGTLAMEMGAEERGSKPRQEMVGYWGPRSPKVAELLRERRGPQAIPWLVAAVTSVLSVICECPHLSRLLPQLGHHSHGHFWLHWCRGPHLAPGGSLVHDLEEMETRE